MLEYDSYSVYVKVDSTGRITAINSSAFLPAAHTNWVKIDEGYGPRYHHAQRNYLGGSLMDEEGVYLYKLVDGLAVERTAEERAADVLQNVPAAPATEERLAAVEQSIEMLLEGVTEDG